MASPVAHFPLDVLVLKGDPSVPCENLGQVLAFGIFSYVSLRGPLDGGLEAAVLWVSAKLPIAPFTMWSIIKRGLGQTFLASFHFLIKAVSRTRLDFLRGLTRLAAPQRHLPFIIIFTLSVTLIFHRCLIILRRICN